MTLTSWPFYNGITPITHLGEVSNESSATLHRRGLYSAFSQSESRGGAGSKKDSCTVSGGSEDFRVVQRATVYRRYLPGSSPGGSSEFEVGDGVGVLGKIHI